MPRARVECLPFFWRSCLVFIMGDGDDFPCWMVIRDLSYWVRNFLSFIVNRLL